MSRMHIASLLLNIVVLLPVVLGLALHLDWTKDVFGSFTPARGILLSIYVAIFLFSCCLLWTNNVEHITALLMVQVMYKVTTPLSVGSFKNPVVQSNLCIALFHSITLCIAQAGTLS